MTDRIPARMAACLVALVAMIATLAWAAASASASSNEVVYNNFNTVPTTVNGHPDQDTYSQDFEGFPFGGMVAVPRTRATVLKSIATQVDSFTCEHGLYSLENCYTLHEKKKFEVELTASVYAVGAGNEPAATPLATSTEKFRIPYRPTTNVSCPATSEGKGFGENCDVGGLLSTIKFKHFNAEIVLPEKFIVLISTNESLHNEETFIVNVGLQSAYKEFREGEFFSEPPFNSGIPAIGSDPLPAEAYFDGKVQSGWEDFQPVFEIVTHR